MSCNFLDERNFTHLTGLYIRNLSNPKIQNTYLTFNLLDTRKSIIYRSHICKQSLNPSFELDDGDSIVQNLRSMEKVKEFEICLQSEEGTVLLTSEIKFSALQFFSDSLLSFEYNLPADCILLEFVDGIFLPEDIFQKNEIKINLKVANRASVKKREKMIHRITAAQLEQNIMALSNVTSDLEKTKKEVTAIRKKLSKELKSSQFKRQTQLQQEYEIKKRSCQRLERLIISKNKEYAVVNEKITRKQKQIDRIENSFLRSLSVLQEQNDILKEKKKTLLPELENKLDELQNKKKMRKRDLISEIKKIYKITISSDGKNYAINGLKVYKPSTKKGEDLVLETNEESAAGLGYVVHCLDRVSKILQTPLRYDITPFGSKSTVFDSKMQLPLFVEKKSEREKYLKAVTLLNFNIHVLTKQILKTKISSEKNVLKNLLRLLTSCANNLE